MNNIKQSIEIMKCTKSANEKMISDVSDKELFGKAIDDALEVMEKRIPKKPIKQYKSCGIAIGYCPCCGSYVDGMKNPFYCTNKDCLQKLDWEEKG